MKLFFSSELVDKRQAAWHHSSVLLLFQHIAVATFGFHTACLNSTYVRNKHLRGFFFCCFFGTRFPQQCLWTSPLVTCEGLRSLCSWTCKQWESGGSWMQLLTWLCVSVEKPRCHTCYSTDRGEKIKCKVSFLEWRRGCRPQNALPTNKQSTFFSHNSRPCLNLFAREPLQTATNWIQFVGHSCSSWCPFVSYRAIWTCIIIIFETGYLWLQPREIVNLYGGI